MINIQTAFNYAGESAITIGSATAAVCLLGNPIGVQGGMVFGAISVITGLSFGWLKKKTGLDAFEHRTADKAISEEELLASAAKVAAVVRKPFKMLALTALILLAGTIGPWQLVKLCGYSMSLKSYIVLEAVSNPMSNVCKLAAQRVASIACKVFAGATPATQPA